MHQDTAEPAILALTDTSEEQIFFLTVDLNRLLTIILGVKGRRGTVVLLFPKIPIDFNETKIPPKIIQLYLMAF